MAMVTVPDARGYFGEFGGRFVPETLMPALTELDAAYREAAGDAAFQEELAQGLVEYGGRPTPLTETPRLAARGGAGRVLLKREDLLHTGAHKLNNVLGQAITLVFTIRFGFGFRHTGHGDARYCRCHGCARTG